MNIVPPAKRRQKEAPLASHAAQVILVWVLVVKNVQSVGKINTYSN